MFGTFQLETFATVCILKCLDANSNFKPCLISRQEAEAIELYVNECQDKAFKQLIETQLSVPFLDAPTLLSCLFHNL